MKPRIALVLGDPAGIGPELVARLFADEACGRRAYILIVPIVAPAHGTGFEISQQGVADVGAMAEAVDVACRMGLNHRQRRERAAFPIHI
jgi:4-hydroxy-L-threonine phosphate dehydrogenase PdxA